MAIYRKKPVEVRAVQFDGYNHEKILREFKDVSNVDGILQIETLEGIMKVSPGDFVVEGTQGEIYPCKPHAFDDGYEYVKESE